MIVINHHFILKLSSLGYLKATRHASPGWVILSHEPTPNQPNHKRRAHQRKGDNQVRGERDKLCEADAELGEQVACLHIECWLNYKIG